MHLQSSGHRWKFPYYNDDHCLTKLISCQFVAFKSYLWSSLEPSVCNVMAPVPKSMVYVWVKVISVSCSKYTQVGRTTIFSEAKLAISITDQWIVKSFEYIYPQVLGSVLFWLTLFASRGKLQCKTNTKEQVYSPYLSACTGLFKIQ